MEVQLCRWGRATKGGGAVMQVGEGHEGWRCSYAGGGGPRRVEVPLCRWGRATKVAGAVMQVGEGHEG